MVTIVGIIGRLLTKCRVCLDLAIISFLLNGFWICGYHVTSKLTKDLCLVQYRNLNGHAGFEMLIMFCLSVMVAGVGVFCYAVTIIAQVREQSHKLVVLNVNPTKW